MLKYEELKEGKCTAITEDGKQYEASYNSTLDTVFYCIPACKKVIGYLQ